MSVFSQLQQLDSKESLEAPGFIEQLQLFCLDDGCYFGHCQFAVELFSPELFETLLIDLDHSVSKAVAKRQAEFLAGRYISRKVLQLLGYQQYQVAVGENRSPVWPDTVVASISHAHGVAVCVAAADLNFVGVDIEGYMSAEMAAEVKYSIGTEGEVALLTQAGFSQELAVNLLFSAKECLFKAIYPKVRRYLDFDTSQLLEVDPVAGKLRLKLATELQQESGYEQDFICHFTLEAEQLITLTYG